MKRKALFLIILIFSLVLISCSAKEEIDGYCFDFGREYAVGIKINSFETKGILTLEEERVFFLHADTASPLYGMRESFDENGYKSLFHGIEWNSDEVKMQTEMIPNALHLAEHAGWWTVERDTFGGKEVLRKSLTFDDNAVELLIASDTGEIMHLTARMDHDFIEIAFGE